MPLFIPLSDDNPHRHLKWAGVTLGLIAINTLIHLVFLSGWVFALHDRTVLGFGLIPSVFLGQASLPEGHTVAPSWLTLVTSLFLHADPWHLAGNMLFLWVFGDNVEDAMGHWRFAVFYLLVGAASGLAYSFHMPSSDLPMIGASGALAGVVAAYVLLFPRIRIWMLLIVPIPLNLPALVVIAAWIILQVYSLFFDALHQVAWSAHVAGFVAGLALVPFFKRRDVPLWGKMDAQDKKNM